MDTFIGTRYIEDLQETNTAMLAECFAQCNEWAATHSDWSDFEITE